MAKKILALDIGNVCLRLRPERCFGRFGYKAITEVPSELLMVFQQLETGRIDEAAFFGEIRRILNLKIDDAALRDLWCAILGEPMPGMAALVRDLVAADIQPVFLSDISTLHLDYFRRNYPVTEWVPDGIYSFVVGACKPSPAMYAAFEADFGKPVLYVDDRPACLEGAAPFGWPTHLFQDAETLRAALKV